MSLSEKFKIREETAKEVRDLYPKYLEAIGKSGCDKYDFCFNGDTRFELFRITLSLTAYCGYYGDSSCYTFRSVGDKKLFEEAFLQVLNKSIATLLRETASVLEAGLEKDRAEYIAKLEAELARVKGGSCTAGKESV